MKRNYSILLSDMLYSIGRIEKSLRGLSFSDFEGDVDVQDITIRRISVIGEAANKIPKEIQTIHKEINWHDLI